jgi:ADP-ribose pyrophosphatase YjhB (NUDIX family)
MSDLVPKTPRFAPREIFEQILDYAVIPTFDLILHMSGRGALIVRRKIPPYRDTWALPGLRMMKPEGIDETLIRIARSELGLRIDPTKRRFIGQYVGRFKTEHQRQDLSTCYAVEIGESDIALNSDHFHAMRHVPSVTEIPSKTGAMYRYYLERFFNPVD